MRVLTITEVNYSSENYQLLWLSQKIYNFEYYLLLLYNKLLFWYIIIILII